MTNLLTRFVRDESGATAIEYGLIAGLVSVVIIGAVTLVGTRLTETFDSIGAALTPPAGGGGGGDPPPVTPP